MAFQSVSLDSPLIGSFYRLGVGIEVTNSSCSAPNMLSDSRNNKVMSSGFAPASIMIKPTDRAFGVSRRLTIIVAFLGTLSVLFSSVSALILSRSPIDSGYHLSPYGGISFLYWISIGLAFLCTSSSFVIALRLGGGRRLSIAIAFISLVLVVFVSGMMPYLRHAILMNRTDTMSYLGSIRFMLISGKVDSGYPAFHAFVISLYASTGIDPLYLIGPFAPLMVIMSLGFYALLARALSKSLPVLLFTLLTAGTFQLSYLWSRPYEFGVILLPLLLAVVFKSSSGRPSWRVILVLLSFLFAFVHPIIVAMIVVWFGLVSLNRLGVRRLLGELPQLKKSFLYFSSLLGVVFMFWIGFFHVIVLRDPIESFWLATSGGKTESVGGYISQLGISYAQAIEYSLRAYFSNVVVGALVVFLLVAARKELRNRSDAILQYGVRFSVLWCIFVLALLAVSSLRINLFPFDMRRFVISVAVVLPPLVGVALSLSSPIGAYRKSRREVAVAALLLVSFLIGSMSLYQSPYVGVQNQQVMEGELSGMAWILEEVGAEHKVYDLGENEWLRGSYPGSVGYDLPYSQFMLITERLAKESGMFGPNGTHIVTLTKFRETRILANDLPSHFYVSPNDMNIFIESDSVCRVLDNSDYTVYLVLD